MNGHARYEMCRAREPELGVQCEKTGPHEHHLITGVRTASGVEMRRWVTCNARLGGGRICLLKLQHDGECEPK